MIGVIEIIAASVFVLGYLIIALEHHFFVNKAAAALLVAALLWLLVGVSVPAATLNHFLDDAAIDIFGIVIFLLTAMTLVEILVHYRFFDMVERTLRARGWTMYHLGWALTFLTFFLSAIIDNLTTTIVMIQIARRLFPKTSLVRLGALIVIAANAGGAFSPIGDVTTIMLWFAQKFTAAQILSQGFLPALILTIVSAWLLLRPIPAQPCPTPENGTLWKKPSRSDQAIILATFASFLLPLAASLIGLPPYLGILAGLAGVWLLIDIAKVARPQETHLQAHIKGFLQKTDIESIQFFIGILLAVGALHALGILHLVTDGLLGANASTLRIASGFVGLGAFSALIDNVPLTAAAIAALGNISSSLWVLLALTVGTGGSMLVIGSAAGVVAMGMVEGMTFTKYVRVATLPAIVGFLAAVVIWTVQYRFFFS